MAPLDLEEEAKSMGGSKQFLSRSRADDHITPPPADLDIYSILHMSWKHKILIASCMLGFGLVGWILNLRVDPIFEGTSVIDVGRTYRKETNKLDLIESPDTVKTLLTSDLVLIELGQALGSKEHYRSNKLNVQVSGDMRQVEILPELFMNITFKSKNHDEAAKGVEFLTNRLLRNHEQFYTLSLFNLDQAIAETQQDIKKNATLNNSYRTKIERTNEQITGEKKYYSYLLSQTPGVSSEQKPIGDSAPQTSPQTTGRADKLSASEIYFTQLNAENRLNKSININREINELALRGQDREKEIAGLTAQISQVQTQSEIGRLAILKLENYKANLKKSTLVSAPIITESKPAWAGANLVSLGVLLGLLVSIVVVIFIENKQKIINGR